MGAQSQRAGAGERANSARAHVPGHSSRPLDARTELLIRAIRPLLEELYSSRLKQLILFGSRARGDFTKTSDADVAIILEGPIGRPFVVKCEVIDATYDLFLDSGIIIQPWPLCEEWLDEPEASPYPHVVRAVLSEGIRV